LAHEGPQLVNEGTPILEARGVIKELVGPQQPVIAVAGVDLTIYAGEFVAITGPSGSGKSTLLYLLGALDRPTRGEVFIDGTSTRNLAETKLAALRNAKIGFVFQFHFLLPELTATDNVAMPLMVAGIGRQEARRRATALLEQVDMSHRAAHRPHELSGGQQQRVAIARALANNPTVLLGDELTGNLDTHNGEVVYQWLRTRNRELKQTIVIVTHNLELAAHADRIIELVDGKVVGAPPAAP
jgi:lipoprotein-releasing system ATP-binding protein